MSNIPIVVTGCQRSGTTLLQLILNSHPEILSIDESAFSYPAINTYLYAQGLPAFVAFKLPQYAPIVAFFKGLPDVRIFWCIRDPLDSIWSMLQLQLNTDQLQTVSWAAHPSGAQAEIINSLWTLDDHQLQSLSPHMQTYNGIMSKKPLERSREECIFSGALCWTIKNSLPSAYTSEEIPFHTVRYESLVSSPRDEIERLLAYSGVVWSDEVLQHHEKHQGVSIGNTDNSRPIDTRGVGQGTENFSDKEIGVIRQVAAFVADEWGYRL